MLTDVFKSFFAVRRNPFKGVVSGCIIKINEISHGAWIKIRIMHFDYLRETPNSLESTNVGHMSAVRWRPWVEVGFLCLVDR